MSLQQACEKKNTYRSPDRAAAVRDQRLAARDGPEQLYVYRCQVPGCRKWHLSKMNPNQ